MPSRDLDATGDERTRRHLLGFLFARVLLFSLLPGGVTLLPHQDVFLPPWPLLVAFVAGILLFSIASALWLRRPFLNLQRFSRCQVLFDLLCCVLLIAHSGGSRSIFLPILIFPASTGSLVLHRHGSLKSAAAATLLLGVCLALDYFGLLLRLPGQPTLPSGQPWPVLLNIFAVYGSTFFLIAFFSELLTRRLIRTERALRESERDLAELSRLYKQIFDDVSVGIITIDDLGRITSYNNAAEQITGFPVAKVLDRPLRVCFAELHLDPAAGSRQTVDLQRADGQSIRVACAHADLRLRQGDPSSSCAGCRVLTIEDVTQLERMEHQMRQAEKMAAIGSMSAAIAHDMRNPLASISGAAQLLHVEVAGQANSTHNRLLDIILRESSRLAAIITDFLQFAQPASASMGWFDGRRLVEETWMIVAMAANRSSSCRLDNQVPSGFDFWGDRQLLQTALRHLLENSRHACREREGVVEVSACEETDTDGVSWLCLRISDNGPGIPPAELEKIFDPFYSTREDGTGLGLAIVRQLVARHHGRVAAENTGCGCAFMVRWPLPVEEGLPEHPAVSSAEPASS
ncbi:MAG: hypothetical protein BWK76_06320 [Desulfobulbaceae bacterium A2]|nr:MAG: hypothetical protein BWK76_06320 [Desulfobulbaceae bacterium A2]